MMNRYGTPASVATVLAAGLLCLAAARPARAQEPVPTLDRVDSLVTAGNYELARTTLTRWWSARDQFDVPGSDRVRGLMLRARLAPDLKTAESDYLAVILGYPTSDYAPEALLRLGQGLLENGDATRAAGYLRRLETDYPGRPQRQLGLLWLARAEGRLRQTAAACASAREGLEAARDPDLKAMFGAEVDQRCTADARNVAAAGSAAGEPQPAGAPAPSAEDVPTRAAPTPAVPGGRPAEAGAVTPRPSAPPAARAATGTERGRYSVQTGAFRYERSVAAMVARLGKAGYDARVARLPGSALMRVRVGRFTERGDAARLAARLKESGIDALVVGDADQEQHP